MLYGCTAPQPRQELFAPTDAQMKIRSAQSRTFEVKDRDGRHARRHCGATRLGLYHRACQ